MVSETLSILRFRRKKLVFVGFKVWGHNMTKMERSPYFLHWGSSPDM